MPVEAKPLFRPDVLRGRVDAFTLPSSVEPFLPKLEHWAELIRTERIDNFRESEILPSFLHDLFETLLGYAGPASGGNRYTISVERHVEVDGKYADAVLEINDRVFRLFNLTSRRNRTAHKRSRALRPKVSYQFPPAPSPLRGGRGRG